MVNRLTEIFIKYDIPIIVIFAVINLVLLGYIIIKVKRANNVLYPKSSVRYKTINDKKISGKDAQKLAQLKKELIMLCSLYANITAVFPILGILGTVAGLMQEDVDMGFDTALRTTLVGAVFAVLFKVLDSAISGPVDVFCDDADFVIRHFDNTENEI